MEYGYFDDKRKEYVITRPDTPQSWSNYLGDTRFGSVITNNAGGYSFFKSAGQGRFTRFAFNAIPMDQPGRYIYIRDRVTKDFWSASWQPVGKPLDKYKTVCRHGTAYTIFETEYEKIRSEASYFVPLGKDYELWHLKLTNTDSFKRNLDLFTYVEYGGNWNAKDDMLNLQYTQYTLTMDVVDGVIDHGTNINIPEMPHNFEEKDQGRHSFLGIVGADVIGFDTDREVFLGPYRSYSNPVVVEKGMCTNSLASGDNGCGTLQLSVQLEPGESKELLVLMGIGRASREGKRTIKAYSDLSKVKSELEELKSHWHSRMEGMRVETPDKAFNTMVNTWNPYNCLITYSWSRAASLVYTADERDGLGYRDSVQDILGIIHNIPDESRIRLELMITGQVSNGGAMPVVKKFGHKPGEEKQPAEEEFRSDDGLWLFNAIPAWVKETGDIEFYNKVLPYADTGEDSVLNHMRRAIEFNLNRSGSHGLACGLKADWNDCLELGQHGESVFVSFQMRFALKTYMEICELLDNKVELAWAEFELKSLDNRLAEHSWDGAWFLRAYREDGLKFGSKENEEGSIFLNPQSWSVISGHATDRQAELAMSSVHEQLATEYGLMVCAPPFEKTDFRVIRASLMNPGMKENGGIFVHTQGWAVMAETMLGHGNRAYDYFRSSMPSAYNSRAEVREIEPYVYCQSTHSKNSSHYGASRIPWLSGSASWAYFAATQHILGIQPDYHGIRIDPCIPSEWKEFIVRRLFRGKVLDIIVLNPSGVQKGVQALKVNGREIHTNLVRMEELNRENELVVMMGN